MFKDKVYITTTLPYSNGSGAHIGHAFEFILADIIAGFYRMKLGRENVFFNTGLDEHGQKVYEKAISENKDPQAYCDEMAVKWQQFTSLFDIKFDNFHRTSSALHKELCLEHFKKMQPYIYKKQYEGLYCSGCESFKTKKEIVDNKCTIHPFLELQKVSEENYFFKLIEFKNYVPSDILVDPTLDEELKNVIDSTEDISISRNAEVVKWGIPIPNSDQIIYVWAEALQSYTNAIKNLPDFNQLWNNSLIICGNDNLRFQTLILTALCNAIDLPGPKKVLVHGMIMDENGDKMSKSAGNIIDPVDQLEKFGADAVRFYLAAGLSTFRHGKYSEKELQLKWNAEVVNGFGNLISRTLHLIDIKNIEINEKLTTENYSKIKEMFEVVDQEFSSMNIRSAYNELARVVAYGNVYFTENRPFSAECENPTGILNDVYHLLLTAAQYYKFMLTKETGQLIDQTLANKKKAAIFKRFEILTTTTN